MGRDDYVVSVGGMGAPTIGIERLDCVEEITTGVHALQDLYLVGQYHDGGLKNKDGVEMKTAPGVTYIDDYQPKRGTIAEHAENNIHGLAEGGSLGKIGRLMAIFSAEVGGSNCMAPLYVGGYMDLPVVDCDLMGRAFPELQMVTSLIYGMLPYPATLGDYEGKRPAILKCDTAKNLEDHFRGVCISKGLACGMILPPMNKSDLLTKTIHYSTSRAWRLGRAVLHARKTKQSTIQAILDQEGGIVLCSGKVQDVSRATTGGFARGQLQIEGSGSFKNKTLIIHFQNEFLVAKEKSKNGELKVLACTPDLISVVDIDSGEPIPTEEMRYGLRVVAISMPASPMLTSPKALAVVGPQAFGYPEDEVKYTPIQNYVEHGPVSPK